VASDARVVIDVIHTGGVSDTSRGLVAGSRELAITTGGQFDASRFPTAAMDLDRIAAGTSFQYLLGYRLPQESGEPRFRQIRVSVNRPGLTVMYRRGYFSPADRSGEMTRRTLQYARIGAAAAYVREIPDLAFQATPVAKTRPDRVEFTLRLDISRLAFERTAAARHKAVVEVAIFCLGSRQREVGQMWKTIEIELTDARRAQLVREGGISAQVVVPVTGRAESAKVVVYDYSADALGSRNVPIRRP
jgi:hypothetical protein